MLRRLDVQRRWPTAGWAIAAVICFSSFVLPCAAAEQATKKSYSLPNRHDLQQQLSRNDQLAAHIYRLLDVVGPHDLDAVESLEQQLRDIELSNDGIYQQLQQVDRNEFFAARRRELQRTAELIEKSAKHTTNLTTQVEMKRKADRIRKRLTDGSWKQEIEREWRWHLGEESSKTDELITEVGMLRHENAKLRAEVQKLWKLLSQALEAGRPKSTAEPLD